MGLIPRTMEVIHNTGKDECTISVIYKEVYHDNKDGEVVETTELHADKGGHVRLCNISVTEVGDEVEFDIPLTLDLIPVLSKMLAKVTEELGEDIQRYALEGEELEREYLETQRWTLEDVKSLFELAGVSEDFCVTKEEDKIVCGGWNRAYLYPNGTVKVSGSHSRLQFLKVANELGIELT